MDAQADLRICCYAFLSRSPIALRHFTTKMRNLIFVKYDITQTDLLFAQSLQSICGVYVDTPRVILLYMIIDPHYFNGSHALMLLNHL